MALRIFTEPQQGASYDDLLAVATSAEECGFGAFFRSDHVLKMGSPRSPTPLVTDAWATVAGLARDTRTIRLGTLVTPITFRAPGMLAVTVAQVDRMSGGRVEVGLGTGWYDAEHTAFGLPFPPLGERMDALEDQLMVLHGLWSTAPGETFSLERAKRCVHIDAETVRPSQRPGPPIVMGGQAGPRSARLAASYAAEYNSAFTPLEETRAVHDRIRAACERAGRDPGSVVYSAAQVLCCGANDAEIARRAAAIGREVGELRSNGLAGTPAEVVDKIGRFTAAGVQRLYLQVLDLTDLDHLRLVAAEVQPHVAAD